jgi:hypothetical protein
VTQEPDSSTGASKYTNTQVRQALNVAQKEMAAAVCAVQRETTYTLVNGRVSYKLPNGFIAARSLNFIKGAIPGFNRMQYRDAGDFPGIIKSGSELPGDATAPNTEPSQVDFITEFTVWGDSLKINLGLTRYSNDKLQMSYCAYPTKLDSNVQESDLPEYADLAVVKFAEWILNSANLSIGEEASVLTNVSNLAAYFIERYGRRVGGK